MPNTFLRLDRYLNAAETDSVLALAIEDAQDNATQLGHEPHSEDWAREVADQLDLWEDNDRQW